MFGFLPAIGFDFFRDHGPGPKHVKKIYPNPTQNMGTVGHHFLAHGASTRDHLVPTEISRKKGNSGCVKNCSKYV